ncbi:chymotrypsin inhibitor-like [Ptiloglossa arizonensis]|uniref:chymotrypsin inhibitor-like n=1 Tax=Ptiloglossa arizonensis TaxID=3350558 RepID=UPI003FA0A140
MVRVVIILLVATVCIGMMNTVVNAQCSPNEQFKQCSSACEPTCSNKYPICDSICRSPKCQCQRGFVRDKAGKCVPMNSC